MGHKHPECNLVGIRDKERQILERAGYFQSITVGVAPIVMVIASVATFSTHMLLGYDLTAAQVSSINPLSSSQRLVLICRNAEFLSSSRHLLL